MFGGSTHPSEASFSSFTRDPFPFPPLSPLPCRSRLCRSLPSPGRKKKCPLPPLVSSFQLRSTLSISSLRYSSGHTRFLPLSYLRRRLTPFLTFRFLPLFRLLSVPLLFRAGCGLALINNKNMCLLTPMVTWRAKSPMKTLTLEPLQLR